MAVADDILVSFLQKTHPVQWVSWWSELPEGAVKQKFKFHLFDGEELKSLTDPTVKTNVIENILKEPLLRKVAESEYERMVDLLADSILKIQTKNLGGMSVEE